VRKVLPDLESHGFSRLAVMGRIHRGKRQTGTIESELLSIKANINEMNSGPIMGNRKGKKGTTRPRLNAGG